MNRLQALLSKPGHGAWTLRGSYRNRLAILAVVEVFAWFAGCASLDGQADARSEILRLDAEWSRAAQSRDVDKVLSFWADDAIVLPPGSSAVVGKAAIREYVVKGFQTPGFSITWKTASVAVSRSGDMAYTTGTNRVTFLAPDGKQVAVEGKAVEVWRREKDGTWKCVVDIWNDVAPAQ
jgi:uncharacterized protein (TIGR02246 family)